MLIYVYVYVYFLCVYVDEDVPLMIDNLPVTCGICQIVALDETCQGRFARSTIRYAFTFTPHLRRFRRLRLHLVTSSVTPLCFSPPLRPLIL